jgi:hypothetical protein
MKKHVIRLALLAVATTWAASEAAAQSALNWNSIVMSGEANPRPWCGQWWGHRNNGVAINSKNTSVGYADAMSPAEKLDKLVGRSAKIDYAKLETWLTCALNSWKDCASKSGQDRSRCLNDSAKYSKYNACQKNFTVDTAYEWEILNHGKGVYGWDSWWGHCNAWGAAAVLYPEPVKSVTYQGQTWTVADTKGLLTEALMDVDLAADGWFGCRYDGPGSTRTFPGKCATEQEVYEDVTPRDTIAAFSKHIGTNRHGVVIDRHTDWEVWNQPLWKYSITDCRESTGAPCAAGEKKKTCQLSFTWAEDGVGYNEVCTPPHGYTTRTLAFSVCVDSSNQVRPERSKQKWEVPESVAKSERWPDFIWVPGTVSSYPDSANPYVHSEFAKIKEIAQLAAGQGGTPPNPATTKDYTIPTGGATIPDNNATGVTKTLTINDAITAKAVSLCVDITHTYRGDLVVKVTGPNGKTDTVWNKQGGSTDDIKECGATSSFINTSIKGTWKVQVADVAAQDVGKWNSAILKVTQ